MSESQSNPVTNVCTCATTGSRYIHIDLNVTVPGVAQPFRLQQLIPMPRCCPVQKAPNTYEVPAHGSKYSPQEIVANGRPLRVPASIANLLRELATCRGSLRIRLENYRRLRQTLPELADELERDINKKVVSKCAVYRVPKSVAESIWIEGSHDAQPAGRA